MADDEGGGDVPPAQVDEPPGILPQDPAIDPPQGEDVPPAGKPLAKKAPPSQKPPIQKAGALKCSAPVPNFSSKPVQGMDVEAISWSIDVETQRATTVTLDDLMAAQPVGCYLSDPLFVNTPAPVNNILGTFSVTQEVKQTNLESFVQEIFFTGPRFGSGYMSATDLRHVPGDYGTRYETVASTPMIENAMVRALRGTNNGADPPVAATPNHPKLDCVNIETY